MTSKKKRTSLLVPDEANANSIPQVNPAFAPGVRYEGLRVVEVGRLVQKALFEGPLRGITLNVMLDPDHLHLTVTVLDALPETHPRAPYDD